MAGSILVANSLPVEDLGSVGVCSHSTELLSLEHKPIQVFLATVGKESSMVPLEVSKSDTIASVKLCIERRKGFVVDQQRLVYAGKELTQDERLLQDYGVDNGDVLHLVLLVPQLVSLTLKTISGDSVVFKVWQADSTKDIYKFVTDKSGTLPPDLPVVTLKGEQLEDSSLREEFALEGESVVCLRVHRPKVRSTSLGRKEVELLLTSLAFQDESAAGDGILRTQSLESEISRDGLYSQQFKSALQQPAKLLPPRRQPISFDLPNSLKELVDVVSMGLHAGQAPSLATEGSGGVYLMKDEYGAQNVAVFKPMDEEPMALNNPRGYSSCNHGEGLKKGTKSGEGAIREVVAYVLDYPTGGKRIRMKGDVAEKVAEGFSGVPPTTMVRCYHEGFHYGLDVHKPHEPKQGSLQQFVHAISSCEDMGSSKFPVEEVHKITVLDLRLANTDRNGGNILVCEKESGGLKLVPIDHGYCLPDKFEDCSFEWLYWPQAQQPYARATLEYIESLDVEEDIELLRQCGLRLRPQVVRNFRISTMLLKKGAAAGLTPFMIGSIMCRNGSLDSKSPIELMLEKAEVKNLKGCAFVEVVGKLVDEHIAMLKSG